MMITDSATRFLKLTTLAMMLGWISPPISAAPLPLSGIRSDEAQPLWSQVNRLIEAMAYLGQPLPPDFLSAVSDSRNLSSPDSFIKMVESSLDRLCLGAVVLRDDPEDPGRHTISFIPSDHSPEILEQGWSTLMVKVVNQAGIRKPLRVDSPGARPLHGSPADKVAERWIDVESYDRRPMKAELSGLTLEYRLIQFWARESGPHEARIAFSAGSTSAPLADNDVSLRIWDFKDGHADGWSAWNESSLSLQDGKLVVQSSGGDPFIGAPVRMAPGEKILSFRIRPQTDSMWQVFWMTESRPHPSEEFQNAVAVQGNGRDWGEYSISFPTDGQLTSIRLDPGHTPTQSEIDWIEIRSSEPEGDGWAGARMRFNVRPAISVPLRVLDDDGSPTTASFIVRDERGRLYPPTYKRLAPDFFFQTQVYRRDGEFLKLPPGQYSVECRRGPESIPQTQVLQVEPVTAVRDTDARRVERVSPNPFSYRVRRWIDPSERGWYSGDHHIHAAGCMHYQRPTEGVHAVDMMRQMVGEDLKVGAVLTWGPCFDYQKQFFTGLDHPLSRYPFAMRYDVEVSGFGSHQSGHLCLLRLKQQIFPGGDSKDHWPTLGMNTLRWAKSQGAITGPAHSAIGLMGDNGRVSKEDGPNGLPNYVIPNYDGIGANEYVVDVTHLVPGPSGALVPAVDFISTMDTDRKAEFNMWYHTLNCGLRVRASGETDFPCITGERVGLGRVYVHCDSGYTYDDWCEGIRQGRSYVSDGTGHLLDLELSSVDENTWRLGHGECEVSLDGPGELSLKVVAAARIKDAGHVPVEVIVNGYPVASQDLKADGKPVAMEFRIPVEYSSWVALRIFPHAHTNPFFVEVGGKPIRPSSRSAQWMLRGVDQCWSQKERTYHPDEQAQAQADYQHAREFYRRIIEESVAE